MVISLRSLYDASWFFLPLLVLSGILSVSSHVRAVRVLFKTTHYYLFGLFAIYTLIPQSHVDVRDLLLDLVTRFYLLAQSAEQLWMEWGNSPEQTVGSSGASGASDQREKGVGKPLVVVPTMPHTYKMRMVYVVATLLYLGWLLLGVGFAFTRL